jgi:hypothetical protein
MTDEWTKVTEGLPTKDAFYLCRVKGIDHSVAIEWDSSDGMFQTPEIVTHWRDDLDPPIDWRQTTINRLFAAIEKLNTKLDRLIQLSIKEHLVTKP